MRTWLPRGTVLAILHAVAQTVTAAFAVHHPTERTLFEALVLGALVGVAAVWGAVDRWRELDARETVWLIAALIAGWGAGILGVIGRAAFVDQTGVSELGGALTGGAAFTALLVVLPAWLGLLAGGWIKPRHGGRPTQRGGATKSTPRP